MIAIWPELMLCMNVCTIPCLFVETWGNLAATENCLVCSANKKNCNFKKNEEAEEQGIFQNVV